MAVPASTNSSDSSATDWSAALDELLSGQRQAAVHFQPIVDLHRAVIAGYETLARFPGPPAASPDHWFHQAEARGRDAELEAVAVILALERLAALPPNTFLTVNVSPPFLCSAAWTSVTDSYPRLDRLVVEITEHTAVTSYDTARAAIDDLRERGALLAVDDAGSGYASLQHVMKLRPDFVKLDREFITGCHEDPARIAMIEAVGSIAGQLDAWVVAEGIETEAELREVMRLGVPLAQGWLLGKPAAEMQDVADEARSTIATFRKRVSDRSTIAPLLDAFPRVASLARQSGAPTHLTLLLDAGDRPAGWAGPGIAGDASRPLLVKRDSPLRAVARRAMTRPAASRYLPMVCTTEEGQYIGTISIERIVTALLNDREPPT